MRADVFADALDAYRKDAEGPLTERLLFLQGLTQIQAEIGAEIAASGRTYQPPTLEIARPALATGQPLFLSVPPELPRGLFLSAVDRIVAFVAGEAGLEEPQIMALRGADFADEITEARLQRVAFSTDVFVAQVAAAVGAGKDADLKPATVAYVLVSALVPFYASAATATVASLRGLDKGFWTLGVCPLCGSPATLGIVTESTELKGGARILWCGLCHTEWGYDRLRCVRCGTQAADKLRYVHVDGDPAHRLHLCDECHGYVRVVFESDLDRPVSMVIEDAVTAVLDGVALSQGYTATGDAGTAS